MLSEFISQNIFWVIAFIISIALLLISLFTGKVKGVGSISVLHLPQLQRNNKSVIIDIRKKTDYKTAHIPEATNIQTEQINQNNKQLMQHKDKTVIIVCQTGYPNSIKSAKALTSLGFSNVHILSGGMANWTKENLPTQSS